MTSQLYGELLFGGWSGADDDTRVHTPWFPVSGDFATFGVEIIGGTGLTLTWNVETRTQEDPSSVATLFTTDNSFSSGVSTATTRTAGGFGAAAKQWFRYRFSTGSTASTGSWVVFRALEPSWNEDR